MRSEVCGYHTQPNFPLEIPDALLAPAPPTVPRDLLLEREVHVGVRVWQAYGQ